MRLARLTQRFLAAFCSLLPPGALPAQMHEHHGDSMPSFRVSLGAQAVGVVTRVSPAFVGRDFTEGYLTQPIVMLHARPWSALAVRGTLDFEGLTLRRGELDPGVYGEGYIDRRHPHTYLHEMMVELRSRRTGVAGSLSAGRGFAPFGTDDPMVRPFVKYPVNHHLAQILERAVVIGAVRAGSALLEGGLFNGDEPVTPADGPNLDRFGDSWAARLTLAPTAGVELQGSHARVASPEFAAGGGSDQRKSSVSARYSGTSPGIGRYALAEFALTDEYNAGRRSFRFTSLLGEGALHWRAMELAARAERTVRPEEERLLDPFRSPRPHTDVSILGRTRWDIATVSASIGAPRRFGVRARPFVELERLHATAVNRPTVFVPSEFYGASRMWSLSAGLRLEAGARHARMGRYGEAEVK
jgi:hypothetical protein